MEFELRMSPEEDTFTFSILFLHLGGVLGYLCIMHSDGLGNGITTASTVPVLAFYVLK
jgi:hypothetical protein